MDHRKSATAAPVLTIAIIALALNLRPTMAGVGPLLDGIMATTGLDHAGAGMLTAFPVGVMGVGALLSAPLQRRADARALVGLGIALIALACATRAFAHGAAAMLVTALLAGAGIALIQALMPAFIKRNYGVRADAMMGMYTTAIMGGAAAAAALAAPLAQVGGWPGALAVWALPALFAWALWLVAAGPRARQSPPPVHAARVPAARSPVWRLRRAWELMLFFGVGTGAYTLVLAWLPPFYTQLGWSHAQAGYLLAGVTVAEVAAGLAVSASIVRMPDRRMPLLVALALLIGGLGCLLSAPLALAALACLLLGLGIGALFPLSLIVALDHSDNPARAGELLAFVQGGGYLIASLMPLVAGALRDHLADLTAAWAIMLAGALGLCLLCTRFSPRSYARAFAPQR
ncbi:MFS transporter [Paraburkholderia acidisoli]|uniref:MFS transporter n=1 Tax=Paraburkholderia acidisoli TaxID=2571748 RepID=A0A7Z2GRY7_9BURK|nr:MFS transporter [Paraburkholderia acidisoli]